LKGEILFESHPGYYLLTNQPLIMKKIFAIVLLFVSLNIWSQTHKSSANKSSENFEVDIQSSDNLYYPGFKNDINIDVLRHFVKTFDDAQNILWRVNGKGTAVSFILKNQKGVSYYDNKGCHLSTIKYYDEKDLDPTVASFAKLEVGKDFSIYLVTELIRDDYVIYDISFQNSEYWCKVKLLRKADGSLGKLSDNILFHKG
jgi:hypothetical protein